MTFPDRSSLERPLESPASGSENTQDVIPPTERNQDPERTDITRDLSAEASRPLTEDERKAADVGATVGERVYAPASERVPREPVPGHREVVEHTDTHTPERIAAGQADEAEPSFTRVPRPSETVTQTDAYTPPMPTQPSSPRPMWMPVGWAVGFGVCVGVGVWLWMRWQRERNKPINRIRRQARQTADDLRDRMPSSDQAAVPAVGLSTAVLPLVVWAWQRSRSRGVKREVRGRADKAARRGQKTAARWTDRAARQAAQTVAELDWQQRLLALKERWQPSRVELEKTRITHR
jgi:hypothetical protein